MTKERIMVVDDEAIMLRSADRVLSSHYSVATCGSPEEALAIAEEFDPDLAILDVHMPGMDGFELMGKMRSVCPSVDVIFVTGIVHELDSKLVRSIRERAFYFLQKPFDREVLLTIVERCLELRRLGAENRCYLERLESELAEACTFQRSLLPAEGTGIEGVSLAAAYEPCAELAGDIYDIVETGKRAGTVLVADVCGHGASAAMLTALVKSSLHDTWGEGYEPLAVLRRIARGIRPFDHSRFVTVFCARIEGNRLVYASAGHPPAFLWGGIRRRTMLEPTGPLVSPVLPRASWRQESIEIERGDRLLLYTDGLVEARGPSGEFGEERLWEVVDADHASAMDVVESISSALKRFVAGRPFHDDLTYLAMDLG